MGGRRAAFVAIACVTACNALSGVGDLALCGDECGDASAPPSDASQLDVLTSSDAPPDGVGFDAATGVPPLGTGRSGSLAVPNGTAKRINAYAAVTSPVAAGGTAVQVDAPAGFGAGDLVLLWQTAGYVGSGVAGPIALGPSDVGHYELVRVASVDAASSTLSLATAVASSYPVVASQVVLVPEYTDADVAGTISAQPWDGRRGGIVVFLATGTVKVTGVINVSGAGFRGGVGIKGMGTNGCTVTYGEPGVGYAAKGEGIETDSYTTSSDGGGIGGRGNIANAAGGGNCHNGAGGGGGHGGVGGLGGAGNGLGGMGGSVLTYDAKKNLLMGGGGGAGDDNNGAPLPSGGNGGGVLFVRADAIEASGTIAASGSPGTAAPANDGSGGGGAGGAVVLVAQTSIAIGATSATGAPGVIGPNGACSGGGAGGVVHLDSPSIAAIASANGGVGCGTTNLQSTAGGDGRVERLDGK